MPACPRSETGSKKVMTRRARPSGANAADSEQDTIAGVEGERYKPPRSSVGFAAGGAGSSASRAGIQGRAAGDSERPPLRSITVAPAFWAAEACLAANPGEPV